MRSARPEPQALLRGEIGLQRDPRVGFGEAGGQRLIGAPAGYFESRPHIASRRRSPKGTGRMRTGVGSLRELAAEVPPGIVAPVQRHRADGRMNPKLRGLCGSEVVRALEQCGFVLERVKGSHHILVHPDDKTPRATVPVHAGKTVKPGTMRSILKQAGLTEDEFAALL